MADQSTKPDNPKEKSNSLDTSTPTPGGKLGTLSPPKVLPGTNFFIFQYSPLFKAYIYRDIRSGVVHNS
jgi:hypothetical protein